jgi:hypothetical protein
VFGTIPCSQVNDYRWQELCDNKQQPAYPENLTRPSHICNSPTLQPDAVRRASNCSIISTLKLIDILWKDKLAAPHLDCLAIIVAWNATSAFVLTTSNALFRHHSASGYPVSFTALRKCFVSASGLNVDSCWFVKALFANTEATIALSMSTS